MFEGGTGEAGGSTGEGETTPTTEPSASPTSEPTPTPTPTPEPTLEIAGTESYVGYYADVDGNGSVDGIIYADLAIGGSGTWSQSGTNESLGIYTITAVEDTSGLKTYTISEEKHTGSFGENYILTASGSGTDRFYVMALSDVDSSGHYWYYSAYSNGMSDYATTTSGDFGAGKQNTITMIAKWNNEDYGTQNGGTTYNPDLWGLIQGSATYPLVTEGGAWFVPSRAEWAAFAEELGITTSNYGNKGLSNYYWSSSQYDTYRAYFAYFGGGDILGSTFDGVIYVRLSATF